VCVISSSTSPSKVERYTILLRRDDGKWNGGRTEMGGGRRNMDKGWKYEEDYLGQDNHENLVSLENQVNLEYQESLGNQES